MMSERQLYLLRQCASFRIGFQDSRAGEPYDDLKSAEWQRGWKWATLNKR